MTGSFADGRYGGSHSGSVGTTNVLVAGGVMNGSGNHHSGYSVGDSHSNIIGGSRSSGTVTTSNVMVTNNAIVFAVQGSGREAESSVGTTHVTVPRKANVIFMVCGSVTDGNRDRSDEFPVTTSNVTIRDAAIIGTEGGSTDYGAGSVFGGGWDTYNNALYSSTRHTNVSVEDETIHGSVYGGGYRGSMGYGSDDLGGSTKVIVSDGTVDGSVYAGWGSRTAPPPSWPTGSPSSPTARWADPSTPAGDSSGPSEGARADPGAPSP